MEKIFESFDVYLLSEAKTKKKRVKTYAEHELENGEKDPSRTEFFKPPKYVVQPAKGDKGFAIVKKSFNRMRPVFSTGVKSVK